MATKLIIPNADFSANSLGKALLSNDELDFINGSVYPDGSIFVGSSTRLVNNVFIDCTNYAVKITAKNTTYIHMESVYDTDGTFESQTALSPSLQTYTLTQGKKYRIVLKNGSAGTSDIDVDTAMADLTLQPL